MGKVRDEAASPKSAKTAPGAAGRRSLPTGLSRFFGNLIATDTYKPTQGWHARIWTAVGLGALVAAGLYVLYVRLADETSAPARFGIPAALAAAFGWFIYRLVNYPPFADFLIATEAEMKKVSWTTWPELKRATLVVIVTVLILVVYLSAVDLIWQALLKFLGVLRFHSSGFGSNAG